MMESTISLNIASQWRIQRLSARSDPVQDGTLQAFGVIGSGARNAFLDLDNP
jgi:hypothetical protein